MSDFIKVEDKKQMNSSKPVLTFEYVEEEKSYKDAILVVPETHYSPKDKVSHLTWNNRLSIGNDFGVITIIATFKNKNKKNTNQSFYEIINSGEENVE